ncbi:hypothetical protein LY76DRAFT_607829 [Colletotrichum caudatum]|nr:hypothetical protein LY76DRAFT_607829 [Colletotrichum caudatum]
MAGLVETGMQTEGWNLVEEEDEDWVGFLEEIPSLPSWITSVAVAGLEGNFGRLRRKEASRRDVSRSEVRRLHLDVIVNRTGSIIPRGWEPQIYEIKDNIEITVSKDSSSLVAAFVARHTYLARNTISNDKTLSLPVVLPNGNPMRGSGGFIRAYAPVLAEVGIDQETFVDFIDTFSKALEPSPWFNALNLAGFAGSAMPEPASMLFGLGVEYATEAALEGHSRYSSNAFIDLPGTGDNRLAVNFEKGATGSQSKTGIPERVSDVVTQKTSASEGWQGIKDQVREMMKMSNGNLDSPEPAPLIFPAHYDEGCES